MTSGGGEWSRSQSARFAIAMALLTLLCAAIYSNTLTGPFVFDDSPNIENNELIRVEDLRPLTLWHAGMESRCTRPVAYMSFAINYYFGAFEVRGYHIVNIVIHWIAGLLVYGLAIDLFRRQCRVDPSSHVPEIAALFAAAIFIAHPIQTQSVTYIVQRMSSMATMFCLLAFVLYIQGRSRKGVARGGLWLASAAVWCLALGTKQTALPLPLLGVAYEWYFRQDLSFAWLRRRWDLVLGALAVMGGVAVYFLLSGDETYSDARAFTLAERLMTQPRVVMRYLGLLLFPHPSRLNLLHDVPVSHSLIDPPTTLLSLLALALIFVLAIRIAQPFRLASFCIVWFFACLSIESSFISLELMFEHRLYLPMVGFSILAASWIPRATLRGSKALAPLAVGLVLLLSIGTYQRNEVWRSHLALWEDAVAKSPDDFMALNNLGNTLRHAGQLDRAETFLRRAVEIHPDYFRAWWNLASVARDRGDTEEVILRLRKAGAVNPTGERAGPYIATAHRLLAKIFMDRSDWSEALKHAEADLRLDPDRSGSMIRIAWILGVRSQGDEADLARAVDLAERANVLTAHSVPRALDTLATVYAKAGRFDDAVRVMRDLLEIELTAGGEREGVIRERLAEYQAAADRS